MMRNIKLFVFVMLVALMSSCRSHKNVAVIADGANPEQARFESVVRNQYKYDALQSKSRYALSSTSLNGKICLESGRRLCLQVNAPILGFEVARVEASQEQVILVDKYDKQYSVLRLADLYQLRELSGREMEALECIMLGRIFIPGIGQATSRDYRQLVWTTPKLSDGSYGKSVGTYQGENFHLAYTINALGRLESTLLTVDDRSVLWEYDGYQEVEKGKWVPTTETITATNSDRKQISASLSLTSPELGESTWRDFVPTSSYKKVPVGQLIETVMSIAK